MRKLGGVLAGVALAAGSLAVVGVAGGPAGGQTPCPAQTLAITGYPTPTLSAPFGVAVDAAGNIYTADTVTDTVYRFNASGTQTLAIPATDATPTLSAPVGVAVDAAGNIYTADAVTDTVYRFDASGTQTLAIPATNATPTLSDPYGVAVDAAGNIYTADPDTDTVYRFCTGVPT
ncbi:MAG TPA: NHL repeat-containing protein, partial [Acidimicrobiia bacterium]|nr:NHL repeat-containing protein [Acidimicrobiia bacterium]